MLGRAYFQQTQPRKGLGSVFTAPNLLILAAATLPFVAKEVFSAPEPRPGLSGPFFPSRAIDPLPAPPLPFFSPVFETARVKPAVYQHAPLPRGARFPNATPFTPIDFSAAQSKPAVSFNSEGLGANLLPQPSLTPPFALSPFLAVYPRLDIQGPFFPARAIDPGPPAPLPLFSPVFETAQRRLPTPTDTSRGLMPPTAAPPADLPPRSNLFESVTRKRSTQPDLLLTQFLPSRDLQPIATMQWLDSAPAKLRSYSNTSLSSFNIPVAAPGEPPGVPESFDRVSRKADYRDTSLPSPRILLDTPVLPPFVPVDFANLQTKAKVRDIFFPNLLHNTLDLPPIATEQSQELVKLRPWRYPETSLPSPRILLDTEVFKPFAEIVWPNGVRRSPLYNIAFDSFFSPDKIPEPPPAPVRVEIDGGGPKKRTKSPKEELRDLLNEPEAQVLVPAQPTPDLPKPLKPVAKVVIVPTYNPPISAIPIDQPLPTPKVKSPSDEEEIAEIRFLISLGLL